MLIDKFQQEFEKRLYVQNQSKELFTSSSFLNRILFTPATTLKVAFENLGEKLAEFVSVIDFNHPELNVIFDGAFNDNSDFVKECNHLLSLAEYAIDKKYDSVFSNLHKLLTRTDLVKEIYKKIDNPKVNRLHVRLLKNEEDREAVRNTKKSQLIDLYSIEKKGDILWKSQPNNFDMFIRFDNAYQEELERAEKKAKRYFDLGCQSMYDEIKRSIDSFKSQIQESYYGFNRISLSNAAIILAKFHNYCFDEKLNKITISRNHFQGYNFDATRIIDIEGPYITECGSPSYYFPQIKPFNYEPRVYPLHELDIIRSARSDNLNKTIDYLESFPEAHNKPIFDHFAVVVPGVDYPTKYPYSYVDEHGNTQICEDRIAAQKMLDMILIVNKFYQPVLVGEKDNKCYFICFY